MKSKPTRLGIGRLTGLVSLAAVAGGSLLGYWLLPGPAAALQLPTTTTLTLPTVYVPTTIPFLSTTSTVPATTLTLPPTTTPVTTAPATTAGTLANAPTAATSIPAAATTHPPVVTPRGGSRAPVLSDGSNFPSTATTLVGELDSVTAETTGPVVGTSDPAGNRLWNSVMGFLRPVLPPRIAEVLLSPLLLLEAVLRALFETGSSLLVPVAALGAGAGWACWKWAPKVEHSRDSRAATTGFLAGWKPDTTSRRALPPTSR